ncbi:MAG: ATP-binding protein [Vicinamibacterales bacterium]
MQYAPEIFRHLKRAIDQDRRPGRFLVTGSQAFALMHGVSESLAGRAAILTLPTLSLEEVFPTPTIEQTDQFLWRSGYPELWQRPDLNRELWMGSYLATYLERDVRQALNVGDLRDFDRLLRAAALRAGQLLSYADIARDVGIAPNTAKRWLSVLAASQQIFLLEPYHRQRRKRLIKAPKLYFNDTGLLCFLLGFHNPTDLKAHAMWGAVWENLVIAEIRKRSQAMPSPPSFWFWRTAQGDEVDLLIETAPDTFAAIECKTAERVTAADLKGVRRLADEYGDAAIASARVVCRTAIPYPLDADDGATAVPLSHVLDTASWT